MRRTNRIWRGLLIALLLLGGVAPAASAESPLSPAGWFGSFGQFVGSWWSAFTGDDDAQRKVVAAGEIPTGIGGDDADLSSSLDFDDGNEVSPRIDPDGAEAAPSEPNG